MCCLFFVLELPRISSFFPVAVLSASCHALILGYTSLISWLLISDSFPPPNCVFRVIFKCILAIIQVNMTHLWLLIAFVGSRNILLSASTLSCKCRQVNSRASFKKKKNPKFSQMKDERYLLLKVGFFTDSSKATGYVGKEEKGWRLQIPLVFELVHMI